MIEYKEPDESNKSIMTENAAKVSLNEFSYDDENLLELKETIISFIESYNSQDMVEFQTQFEKLNGILSLRNEKFIDLIINSDLLLFLEIQMKSTLHMDILSMILEIMKSILFFRDETITRILYDNGTLETLNSYINGNLTIYILGNILDCIGYATFDLYKINIEPIFNLQSDEMYQVLEANPILYPRYMNLLSNTLFCMRDYGNSIEFIKFYIEMIDLDRCFPHHISHLFQNIIQRIKISNKNKLNMDYYFINFKETNLIKIICEIFWKCKFHQIMSQKIDDVLYYTLKLMLTFLDKDDDDLFFNEIKIISPLDYYKVIISNNSSFNDVGKTFELLTVLMRKESCNYYIHDFYENSYLKTGKLNLFNFIAFFDNFSFKVTVWYLRFLALVIFSPYETIEIDKIESLFHPDFIEFVISLLDVENLDISKSALLVINAILTRSIKENLIFVIDYFMGRENPFDVFIDNFCEELDVDKSKNDYTGIKDLALVLIRTMSEANTKRQRKDE